MSVITLGEHRMELQSNLGAKMPLDFSAYDSQVQYPQSFAQVCINLTQETQMPVYADGGAMIWIKTALTPSGKRGVEMDAKCECADGCKRQCAGESCFFTEWTGVGTVAFSFKLPGDILPFGVEEDIAWKVGAGGYICGTNNNQVTVAFSGCAACCCGGEDPFFTLVKLRDDAAQKQGMFWAGGYGAITRHEIGQGEVCYLNQGLFFASNEKAVAAAECCIAGPLGCVFGNAGRGFFCLMKFTGPAVVYSQNKSRRIWNTLLQKPKKGGKAGGGGAAAQGI